MPRVARKDINTNYIHIMIQGIERRNIFQTKNSKLYYLNLLSNNLEECFNVYLLAYCIMDNHIHLLMYCENKENLSKIMNKTNTSYALWYNKMEDRVGYVYRSRYHIQAIKDEKHLLNCLAYIHNNPVKAKMVRKMSEYSYSSYNLYKTGKMPKDIVEKVFHKKDYMQQFDYIHRNFDEEDFLDVAESKASKDDLESLIDEFVIQNNITIDDLRKNNYFLIKLIEKLKADINVTNKQICEVLKIGKNRITNILNK